MMLSNSNTHRVLLAFALVAVAAMAFASADSSASVGQSLELSAFRPWMNVQDTPAQRAAKLLAQMNQTEKINMVHGWSGPYVGNVIANTRLGIPALNLNDGPQGFRYNAGPGTTTQWPSGLTMGATWNRTALEAWGRAMGVEFVGKGANVQLGPGLCIARVPRNGRNFEYLSGEDPYLGYTLVQPAVRGIQSQGVIANAKHYIMNNQETNRQTVSENVDERTMMEIYEGPFVGAVEGGVLSIMCSYNRINQVYSCENAQTLSGNLKKTLGYQFWVMSDWGATHSTVQSALNGLDQEMPSDTYFGSALQSAIASGSVPQSALDDKVTRILTAMFTAGIFDNPTTGHIEANVTSIGHNQLARQLSAEATVLLSNNGILPLDQSSLKTVAVIGAQAKTSIITGGGGSGRVVPYYQAAPLDAIQRVMNSASTANCKLYPGIDFYQPGNQGAHSTSAEDCCMQCSARDGCNAFSYQASTSMCWFKPNTAGKKSSPDIIAGTCSPSNVVYNDGTDVSQATADAKSADVAIVFVATTSSEGSDRPNLSLPDGQDALVEAIAAAQKNTIVVITTPGALLTPWSDKVAAVLTTFMPGQEFGNAIADVLFGDVNPSARLPLTFPNVENEVGFQQYQYPGLPADNPVEANYTEKLEVGYRWYNAHEVKPKFAFGHGLSYTTFEYMAFSVSGRTISFNVRNSGKVPGAEVPQLYLGFPSSAGEPPKQLKGFSKIMLNPNEEFTVSFTLTDRDLSIWDVTTHSFTVVSGMYDAYVGSSSEDIRLHGQFTI